MTEPQADAACAEQARRQELERILAEEGRELLLHRMRKGILMGIPLYLGFGVLDWLIARELWTGFFLLRLGVVAIAIVTLVLPVFGVMRDRIRALSFLVTYSGAAGIAAMTVALGGFTSQYYIGILTILFLVGLFCPWGFRLTAIYALAVIGTYVGLNLAFHEVPVVDAAMPTFFLVGTSALTCLAADAIERSRRREITLRFRLEAANEELKELDEAKTSFFANVSHELRTPLMLILGPLESLRNGEAGEDPGPLLRAMDSNAHRLLRQVNMILNFSKLEAGQQEVSREIGSVGALLDSLVAGAAPYASGRGITLTGEGLEAMPDIPFDREKIETAAANLISNAMKFTPDGGSILVRGGAQAGGVWFEVEDTGCGIPEDQQEKVFERFHQVDGGKGGKIQGTGLGLSLSKELVEMHGGRMSVRSQLGEGTTFRIELPDADAIGWSSETTEPKQVPVTAPQRTDSTSTQFADLAAPGLESEAHAESSVTPDHAPVLLVVEDNPDMRAFVAGALRRRYRVHTAVDGVDGIEVARRVRPDLIVSDVMMPRMDGFEMVRKLREEAAFDRTPIVMLTARTGSEAVIRGLNLGAVDYVSKPFKMPELVARISAQLSMRAVEAELAERDSRLVAVGQMTGIIAHDLRGPLTGIYNRIELLRMVADRAGNLGTIGEDLDSIERTVQRINGMIQELLDFVGGSRKGLDRRPVRIASWLAEVADDLQPTMVASGVKLEVTSASGEEVQCALDPDRMRRVFENLLNNAREAMVDAGTEDARVDIVIEAGPDEVTVRVEDNGPGIPDEIAETLFQPFATAGKAHGTGLGLAVARNLVVAHNGEIEVLQTPGAGAAFRIRLPRLRSGATVNAA